MPLSANEIRVGAVAYFDVRLLAADGLVIQPPSPTTRPGPFVCFQETDGRSAWAQLTKQAKPHRLVIPPQWRSGGPPNFSVGDVYLNDGCTTYVGPHSSFVAAASNETPFRGVARPSLVPDAIDAIIAEVHRRGGTCLE